MSDHERIWLEPSSGADEDYGRQWCQHNVWGDEATEYVHADLHASLSSELNRLREENDRLRKALERAKPYVDRAVQKASQAGAPSMADILVPGIICAALSPDNSTQKKEEKL